MAVAIETGIIYQGDCKEVLSNFPSESVDLIYIDPPFYSGKPYEFIWGNGAERKAFEDRWKGGIMNYIGWMKERVEQMHRVLKKDGVMLLHCDWHASHYLKVHVLDALFRENNFKNEIVWHYRTGGVSKNWFARKHDVVFFYVKGKKYTFHPIEVKEYYTDIYGEGFKPGWEDRKGGKDSKGYFRMAFKDDVWNVPSVFNMSKEYMGYPTQKPEALLELLINSTSNKDDIVLDAMVGGGTTLVVANRLKRRWIGIDVSPIACKMAAERLRKNGVRSVNIISGLITEKELRKFEDFQFQRWACDKLFGRPKDKKSGDMGIDGFTFDGIPIQVKQSDDIGRNVVDNFGWAIERVKKNKGIIVAFSFGKGAYEEVARAKIEKKIDIKLITVKELLENHDTKSLLEFK